MQVRVAPLLASLIATASFIAAPSGHAAAGWQRVRAPAANSISGVAAASTNDVWAGGQSTTQQPFAAHWGGRRWARVATPALGSGGLFDAVAVTPSGDVWAVGSQFNDGGGSTTLAERWNGSSWQVFSTPNGYGSASDLNELVDVSVVAGDDIWAVGISDRTGVKERSIIAHWDGVDWTVALPTGKVTALASVSMLTSAYGLAVGQLSPPGLAVSVGFSHGTWNVHKLSGSQGQL